MRFLRQNTAVRITVGPFRDFADGVTPLDAMTVTDISAVLVWDDDDGTGVNHTPFTPAASASNNDLVAVGHCGMWDQELTATNTNITGRLTLTYTDADQICPLTHEFQVLAANVYDSFFAGVGPIPDLLDVNTAQWLGTAPHTPAVAGLPVVQLHGTGSAGVDAPTNFEDLSIVNTTGTVTLTPGQTIGGLDAWPGTGDIAVDHTTLDTNGDDLLVTLGGDGLDEVAIRAYLKSEYDVGGRTVRGNAVTKSNGTWAGPMYLDAGTYTLTFSKGGAILPFTTEVEVE